MTLKNVWAERLFGLLASDLQDVISVTIVSAGVFVPTFVTKGFGGMFTSKRRRLTETPEPVRWPVALRVCGATDASWGDGCLWKYLG